MFRYIITLMPLVLLVQYHPCETCSVINACQILLQNRSMVDLTSLGYHDKARFPNMKAVVRTDNFTYSYNPCFSFKMDGGCDKGVAVCQSTKNHENINCGNAYPVTCSEKDGLELVYVAAPRTTRVKLVCSEDAFEPRLVVNGELVVEIYEMTLTSRCACPDLCQESHLSPGSVLVIIFMIFVALYLVLGIIHSSLTRGASGWELIPHHEFWSDFPLLVRDGCVFVVSGCKPETAYERI